MRAANEGSDRRRAKAWCFGVYGATPGHEAEASGHTDAELREAWNRRASASDLAARLETALGLLDELTSCLDSDCTLYSGEITKAVMKARAFLATIDADTAREGTK
jgi:hypothetical protein